MDYLNDTLESTLAERLNLRSVNACVDWYSEEKSVVVDAWQLDNSPVAFCGGFRFDGLFDLYPAI